MITLALASPGQSKCPSEAVVMEGQTYRHCFFFQRCFPPEALSYSGGALIIRTVVQGERVKFHLPQT